MKELCEKDTMLKIDAESFDEMIAFEFGRDEEYNKYASNIKSYMKENNITDDSLINSIILRVSEIVYNKGFKDGINIIVERDKINLFD